MGAAIDPTALDRDVRAAAARVEKRDAWLRAPLEETRAKARDFDPFDGLRHTAGQSTYRALLELEPNALRDALLRWVHELLQARIDHELSVDEAEAIHAIDPRLTERQKAAAELPTFADATRAILTAKTASLAALALERAGDLAAPVAAVRRERHARRAEAARRLGLADADALAAPDIDLRALSRALLDATEPLSAEILRRARREHEGPWTASSAIQLALAKGARDGWPAHLNARWLDDAFRALAPRAFDPGPLPAPIGGATFLRAASQWGAALRSAGAPRSTPFAVARDPYPVAAYRFGHAIATALASPPFQRRVLGLPSRLALAQSRHLRTSMLLHARTLAVRVLLASAAPADARVVFEELTSRLFGAPLPASLEGAWPAARVVDAARIRALLDAHAFVHQLVDRFDEDWFANPKAGAHLASLACGPAFDADPPAEGAPANVARAFEEALG
ncbi:MAG: hypothetical protein KF819_03945 [Labilithrix sp.]|nr:hypothetical protein [Labilithrix sp.]